ncbi:MAG: NAD-dependent epimerase/dehydratase family protein [Acidobacteria bacterium]|nr:NAD-dependent epimerase/dehydratase family protein [Acidobacteriota bacterium]MCB9398226.1 NAD-dependent epimerase/dehydratase family protein [Acidobacteriota bacterium]
MKKVLILGASGFLGSHLAVRLKNEGHHVVGADRVAPAFRPIPFDGFVMTDLRDANQMTSLFNQPYDAVYQFAAEMGGAGFIFSGENDAEIMHASGLINLNVAQAFRKSGSKRLFFASSACVYPTANQNNPEAPHCHEDSVYPASPDSEYGWEKLFAERLYQSFARQYGFELTIARLHNVYGPFGVYQGGREKAPAALCRKVALAQEGDAIEIWGDGHQTRSFTYIEDCLEGIARLMAAPPVPPINLGSDEMVSINQLAQMIIELSGKRIALRHVPGPQGVRGRNSDNRMIREVLGWQPNTPLQVGLKEVYAWIAQEIKKSNQSQATFVLH